MSSAFRDPKTLAEWIELDYFRRQSRFRLTRSRVTWATFILSLALLSLIFWWDNRRFYQAGPVSTAHAMFNNDCARCHAESFQTAQRLLPGKESLRAVHDQACLQCHEGAIHSPHQGHQPNCASCHKEHRGNETLARVADGFCISCHADLKRKDGTACQCRNVSSFAVNHPDFALLRAVPPRDPGTIRFNHAAHLKAEGVLGPDLKAVRLDCAGCHEPDSERRYMVPVNYDRHCRQCHPLQVQIAGDWKDEKLQDAAREFSKLAVPHLRPALVRAVLRERLQDWSSHNPEVLGMPTVEPVERPLPGARASAQALDAEAAWVKHQSQRIENGLFNGAGGCRFCHQVAVPAGPERLPEYAPSYLLQRWFRHSSFHHDSHRMLKCTECHAVEGSRAASDVLMPGVGVCQQCHHPGQGARSDCVECHRYHDRGQEDRFGGSMTIRDLFPR